MITQTRRQDPDQHPTKPDTTSPRRQRRAVAADELHNALQRSRSLAGPSAARDCLWLALRDHVTTRGECWVSPIGSQTAVLVTANDADSELIAAWEWLQLHENEARDMPPRELYAALRGAATRSARGSARSAQSDQLHGLTKVPGEAWVYFGGELDLERANA
jgi:hypothetical protein